MSVKEHRNCAAVGFLQTNSLCRSPYNQSWLRLQVRDTGIGIKAEDFEKLFTEFQQLDSGTDRRYQGTGLGLAPLPLN